MYICIRLKIKLTKYLKFTKLGIISDINQIKNEKQKY